MNSPVDVTGGRNTSVLTAGTASGSGGPQPNRPLLLAPGPIQMQERWPCPGKGVDWLRVYFPAKLSPSTATLNFNWNILFQLLSEPGLVILIREGIFPIFFWLPGPASWLGFQPCCFSLFEEPGTLAGVLWPTL